MKTKPYNRHETFLAALSDSSITVPTPLSREELYLAKIAGESVTIPSSPYNRYETFLAKMAGENVTAPTPASRIEYYMYKACGYGNTVPVPASREEVFWARYAGYDAGGSLSSTEMFTVSDAASEPARRVLISVNPVQSGTGDPSGTNIRTITGWESVSMRRTGKNVQGGSALISDLAAMMPSATVDSENNTITFNDSTSTSNISAVNFKALTQYTFMLSLSNTIASTTSTNLRVRYMDGAGYNVPKEKTAEKQMVVSATDSSKTIQCLKKNGIGGITVLYGDESGVFEGYVSATEFEEYKGATYTFDLTAAGTVYGGTIDIRDGVPVLTVTNGEIDSYNNEELPGKWISDRDVYAAGTKPTVGAQVVYELDEDDYEQYQLPTVDIKTLSGVNNIWADCGPVSVTYIPDL